MLADILICIGNTVAYISLYPNPKPHKQKTTLK